MQKHVCTPILKVGLQLLRLLLWSSPVVKPLLFIFSSPSTVAGTKVFVMPGGMMKSNAKLVDLIEKVKPEIRTLIEKCNTVRSFIPHSFFLNLFGRVLISLITYQP